jgi:hypothetical protein
VFIHELGHIVNYRRNNYQNIWAWQLMKEEKEAWKTGIAIAKKMGIKLPRDYKAIKKMALNSYRKAGY